MRFNPEAWSWPQWTLFVLLALGLAVSAALHGKPRTDNHGEPIKGSFPVALVRFSVCMFLLICGGFFG